MILLFYLVSGFILAIGLLGLKKPFFTLSIKSVSLFDVLISDLDEDSKYDMVSSRVSGTIGYLLLVFLGVVAVSTIAYGIIIGGEWVLKHYNYDTEEYANYGLAVLAVGSILPFLKKRKRKGSYSELSQLFHKLVLDNENLGKRLFSKQIKGVENPVSENAATTSAVIITGLARAGTTALTREIASRGSFSSLNYSNMPLVLSPGLWGKFYKPKKTENQERAHGDGIKVGFASVEALEEYFFKVFGPHYIEEDSVKLHRINEDVNTLYRKYQKSITGDDKIYLAKNNNCITRYEGLRFMNPDFKIYFLFRDPLQHSNSLFKQHLKFEKTQDEDPFVLTYMNWLGHYEFGKGQKPFDLPNNRLKLHNGDPEDLDYWLSRWINYYSYVISLDQISLINYDSFLKNPEAVLKRIGEDIENDLDLSHIKAFSKKDVSTPKCDPDLQKMAYDIYDQLKSRSMI